MLGAGAALVAAAVVGVRWWGEWRRVLERSAVVEAREQVQRGGETYRARCASCHEEDGGTGPRLTGAVLGAYGSPQRLFDYTRLAMPYDAPGALSPGEYWDVVAFMASSRRLVTEPLVLTPQSAAGLAWSE